MKLIEIYQQVITEQLIFENSSIILNEVFILCESKDENTFEWDITKEKIDKSKEGISSKKQAEKYLNMFLDKIKSLPKSIKVKLTKYALISLITVIGVNSVDSIISSKAPEIKQELSLHFKNLNMEVPEEVQSNPTISSDSLKLFLKREEGSVKEKGNPVLNAYRLGDGMITIGWGHAEKENKSKYALGQSIDINVAQQLFNDDVEEAENGLNRIFKQWKHKGIDVKIDQNMYDAMTSMIFNMGIGNFRKSEFIQEVKKNNFEAAKDLIPQTNVTYAGHIPRRALEAEMFGKGMNNLQIAKI